MNPFRIIKSAIITYKQALRGLFTTGTSSSRLQQENNGKGRQRTRIESRFIIGMSS